MTTHHDDDGVEHEALRDDRDLLQDELATEDAEIAALQAAGHEVYDDEFVPAPHPAQLSAVEADELAAWFHGAGSFPDDGGPLGDG